MFFFQAEDGIRDTSVTGVQTCALPISCHNVAANPVQCGLGNHDADGTASSARKLLECCHSSHIGSTALNLQRLFTRSMTGPDPVEPIAPPSPRSARRKLMFVSLAGALAIFGALAAGYYFAMRPVSLRIAVGPAHSDDLKVVPPLAPAFGH